MRGDFTDLRKLTAEQLRAEINHTATLALHTQEAEDAVRFEQERIAQEKRIRGDEL